MALISGLPIIYAVAVAEFDILKGNTLSYKYPENVTFQLSDELMGNMCLPDGAHIHESDVTYMVLPTGKDESAPRAERFLYGVGVFRNKADATVKRGAIQKSMLLVSPYAHFNVYEPILRLAINKFIDNGETNTDTLKAVYEGLMVALASGAPTASILGQVFPTAIRPLQPDEFNGASLLSFVNTFGEQTMLFWYGLLLRHRILFSGQPAKATGNAAIVAPALVNPLSGFTERITPYLCLNDISPLQKDGFICGTTNLLFGTRSEWWDLMGDVSTGVVTSNLGLKVTSQDRTFIKSVIAGIANGNGETWVYEQFNRHTRLFLRYLEADTLRGMQKKLLFDFNTSPTYQAYVKAKAECPTVEREEDLNEFIKQFPEQMDSDGYVTKEGYMEKMGYGNTTWKKRWFVLVGDRVDYYENEKEYIKNKPAKGFFKFCEETTVARATGGLEPLAANAYVVNPKKPNEKRMLENKPNLIKIQDAKTNEIGLYNALRTFYVSVSTADGAAAWLSAIATNLMVMRAAMEEADFLPVARAPLKRTGPMAIQTKERSTSLAPQTSAGPRNEYGPGTPRAADDVPQRAATVAVVSGEPVPTGAPAPTILVGEPVAGQPISSPGPGGKPAKPKSASRPASRAIADSELPPPPSDLPPPPAYVPIPGELPPTPSDAPPLPPGTPPPPTDLPPPPDPVALAALEKAAAVKPVRPARPQSVMVHRSAEAEIEAVTRDVSMDMARRGSVTVRKRPARRAPGAGGDSDDELPPGTPLAGQNAGAGSAVLGGDGAGPSTPKAGPKPAMTPKANSKTNLNPPGTPTTTAAGAGGDDARVRSLEERVRELETQLEEEREQLAEERDKAKGVETGLAQEIVALRSKVEDLEKRLLAESAKALEAQAALSKTRDAVQSQIAPKPPKPVRS